jgi:hypothetical protein
MNTTPKYLSLLCHDRERLNHIRVLIKRHPPLGVYLKNISQSYNKNQLAHDELVKMIDECK